jgi:iodotyrosine deiodinase
VNDRRSIRTFSPRPVDMELVKKAILCAGTSPSGAHTEPWTFCLIKDPEIKQQIREIVENEEFLNYSKRMSKQWTTDLKPLRTNHVKEYLTTAPYIILVFKQTYGKVLLNFGFWRENFDLKFPLRISTTLEKFS